MSEKTLDERIDKAADDNRNYDKFKNVEWSELNDSEFARKSHQVFSQMKKREELRTVADKVRRIDEDIERRQADESRDDG